MTAPYTQRANFPTGGGGVVLALLALFLFAGNASAQDAQSDESVEEIVVTGSRIPSANLSELSPVTQIDSDELLFQGTARVEDLARTIPQIWSDQNTGQSNGATGTATVNLRNLGEERTLVLINGRRMPAGTPLQGGIGADINQIPGTLIDRVEILTGGASAAYGSDAVAGVVNFWLDDDFQGLKLDFQKSGFSYKNDSGRWRGVLESSGELAPSRSVNDGGIDRLALTMGGNFDGGRGNATAYLTWRKISSILQADRDYSACALSDDLTECFGSSTIPQGRFTPFGAIQSSLSQVGLHNTMERMIADPDINAEPGAMITIFVDPTTGETRHPLFVNTLSMMTESVERGYEDDGTPFLFFPDANGNPTMTTNAAGEMVRLAPVSHNFDYIVSGNQFVDRDGETFNYGRLNYFQRPDERFTFGAFTHYEITPDMTVFAELMFMDDRTVSQIAPSGAFFITDTLACDNAFLSKQQYDELCGQFLENDELIMELEEIQDLITTGMQTAGGNDFYNPDAIVPVATVHPLLGVDNDGNPLVGLDANGDPIPVQSVALGRRNVEGGNRQQDLRHTSFRIVTGVKGDLDDNWSYEAFYQYSEVSMQNTYFNDLSQTRVRRALDVPAPRSTTTGERLFLDGDNNIIDGDGNFVDETGAALAAGVDPVEFTPQCRSTEPCVPWNVFETGGVTDEAVNFLVLPLFARGTTDQTMASAFVTGDLGAYGIRLPTAETPATVAFGVEYREENLDFQPDTGFQEGDGAGQGGATPPVSGGYDAIEIFAEIGIPLIEGMPFAQEVVFDASYRYSDYSYDVDTHSYGLRLGWVINDETKLRTSWQRAVRAPNVRELFRPTGLNLFDLGNGDPCAGALETNDAGVEVTANGATFEECERSGVTRAQYGNIEDNPAGQYNFLQGGSLDLVPEEGDSFSFGVVYTPENEVLAGLSLTLDYFQIKVENGIDNLSPEFILNQCHAAEIDGSDAAARAADPFCSKIRRGGSGDLWVGSDVERSGLIESFNSNLAVEEVAGIDLTAEYGLDLGEWGELKISDVMSLFTTWDRKESAVAPVVDCSGTYGGGVCGYPTPDFQNNLRLTWTSPWNVRVSLLWRHISKVEGLDVLDIGGETCGPDGDDQCTTTYPLKAVNYIDLTALWDVRENINIRVGVSNLFGTEPPIVGSNLTGANIMGNGNTFPGVYDAFGRYAFIAATLNY